MKKPIILFPILLLVILFCTSCTKFQKYKENIVPVNSEHFLTNNTDFTIETIEAELSNGTMAKCYKLTTVGLTPTDHQVGPWCPEHLSDDSDKGGIWFKDGKIYDVDGTFISNLPTIYHDDFWKLHDDEGNVKKTNSKDDCLELVGAQLVEKFKNYCIECLPEYIATIEKTYIIPVTPIRLKNPISLNPQPQGNRNDGPPNGRPDSPPNGRPEGPPPGDRPEPQVRGVAFNGIPFDAPAPTDIILSGYTIPPLDDAGGHINLDTGYHYHAATGKNTKHSHNDTHAAMIGYAMDGFGIYEQLNAVGEEPQDLDECRGHYDDVRGYHYHVDAPGNNNFINCFAGAIVVD